MKRSNIKVNARSKSIRWNTIRLYTVIIVFGVTGAAAPAAAQTEVTRSVIASGGGIAAGSGMILVGTIGQGTIGPVTNGQTTMLQGFWYTPLKVAASSVRLERSPDGGIIADISPNPSSGITTLRVATGVSTRLHVTIVDAVGRGVKTLYNGDGEANGHQISFDARSLPAGAYMIRVITSNGQKILPLVIY
jgi:hypothetical protein